MTTDVTYELNLFGSFILRQGERLLPRFRSQTAQWLFAYLALDSDGTVLREDLLEPFWPKAPDQRDNLSSTLVTLRKDLEGTDLLIADRRTVGLRIDLLSIDVTRFDRLCARARTATDVAERAHLLENAYALYKGKLLYGCDGTRYEWALNVQNRYKDTYLEVCANLAIDLDTLQDWKRACHVVECAREVDPLDEPLCEIFLRMLARQGEVTHAVETYRLFEQRLKTADLPPSPKIRELIDRIQKNPGDRNYPLRVLPESRGASASAPRAVAEATPVISALPPGNLPSRITSFIGRDKEREELRMLLTKGRLVTLVGMGGNGKTRLAIQTGFEIQESYLDRVYFVALDSLTDPIRIASTITRALQIQEKPKQTALDAVIETIGKQKLLIILDNCEHLLESCAKLAAELLHSCPNLTILATSREALRIAGEQIYTVSTLTLPTAEQPVTLDGIHRYSALQLFVDRARLANLRFAVAEKDLPTLVKVCRRLDGIPLALELVAARLHLLSLEDLNQRLGDRFPLKWGGDQTVLPRQRTLEAVIDWSYNLLSAPERRLFARLSVFNGGWTYGMAQSICMDGGIEGDDVLDLMATLTYKSLILANTEGDTTRYTMLETLREYAQERLKSFGERPTLQTRHRDRFQQLVVDLEPKLTGPEQNACFDQLTAEFNNLRTTFACYETAATTGILERTDAERWLQMVCLLWPYWYIRGPISEGIEWLEKAIQANQTFTTTNNPFLARANNAAGTLAKLTGEFAMARGYHTTALEIARSQNRQAVIAASLNNLALVELSEGNKGRACVLFEESGQIFRDLNSELEAATVLANLGMTRIDLEEFEIAREHLYSALVIFRRLQSNSYTASVLENLTALVLLQGDQDQAKVYVHECIQLRERQKNWSGVAFCIQYVAIIAIRQGDFERGAFYLGVANAHLITDRRSHSVLEHNQFQQDIHTAIEQMTGTRFQQIMREGSTKSIKGVIEEIVSYLGKGY